MKTVVLGGGIAGLAYLNNADKEDAVLYEKEDVVGGLCSSFKIQGFTFDSAVHFSFTDSEIVRSVFDKEKNIKHLPIAYNYYKDRWLKHPIINNLSLLDIDEKCECIEDYVTKDTDKEIENYEDWLLGSYGKALTEKFYNVYTKKYWTMEPKDMSVTWIGKRLATSNLHKILYGALQEDTGIDYYTKEMRYPEGGGYQRYISSYMNHPNIKTGKKVIEIDADKKQIYFEDGTTDTYDKIVSSLPLKEMPKLVKNTPVNVKEAAERLSCSKISIVSVGFNKPDIPKYLWMYIYDEDIKAARINSPSIKSPNNVPKGCSSMQFEIYHKNNEIVDSKEIIENVKYSLKKMNICKEEDILFMDYRMLPYGNVIFYNGMEEDRKIVKEYMNSKNIELIGRFGEWDYLWSDQSFLSGYNCAKRSK